MMQNDQRIYIGVCYCLSLDCQWLLLLYVHGRSYICLQKHANGLIYVDSCVKHIVLTLIKYTDMVSHETNVEHLLNMK